jgi:hypothetical protein
MVEHLKTQSQQAVDSEEVCAYRNDRGDRCVVGALIPDDQYEEEFEGYRVLTIAERIPALSEVNVFLLNEMQSTYDTESHWGRSGFRGWHLVRHIGNRYSLDVSKCPTNDAP